MPPMPRSKKFPVSHRIFLLPTRRFTAARQNISFTRTLPVPRWTFPVSNQNICYLPKHFSASHCKKRLAVFPSPAGMSVTKLSLAGKYFFHSAPRTFLLPTRTFPGILEHFLSPRSKKISFHWIFLLPTRRFTAAHQNISFTRTLPVPPQRISCSKTFQSPT